MKDKQQKLAGSDIQYDLTSTNSSNCERKLTLSVSTKRNIVLISFGAFIFSIYLSIQGQFLNDHIANLANFTPLVISLMVSLISLTGAVVSIFTGAISDNLRWSFGKRRIFILAGGITSALFLFLLPLNDTILFIISINVVLSILNTAAFVSNNSLIPDLTEKNKLGKINSFASIGTAFGTVAGFAIMMIANSKSIFYLTGAICSLGFLVLGLFFQEPLDTTPSKPWFQEVKKTFKLRNLLEEKKFFKFIISHFFLHTGINSYMPFLLIFLTQSNNPTSGESIGLGLTIESGEILIVFAVMTIISLVATIPFGYLIDRSKINRFLIISRIAFALSTILLALTPIVLVSQPLVSAIIFIIPFSVANTADTISRSAVIHQLCPESKRGQFLGIQFLVKILAQIPGAIIGGLLAQFLQYGYLYTFIIGGVFLLISIPFLIKRQNEDLLNIEKISQMTPS